MRSRLADIASRAADARLRRRAAFVLQQIRLTHEAPARVHADGSGRRHIERQALGPLEVDRERAGVLTQQNALHVDGDPPCEPLKIGLPVDTHQQAPLHFASSPIGKGRQPSIEQGADQPIEIAGRELCERSHVNGLGAGRNRGDRGVDGSPHTDDFRLETEGRRPAPQVGFQHRRGGQQRLVHQVSETGKRRHL